MRQFFVGFAAGVAANLFTLWLVIGAGQRILKEDQRERLRDVNLN